MDPSPDKTESVNMDERNGLRGTFMQLANLTAVGVGLVVNVMLIQFMMAEVKEGRKYFSEMDTANKKTFIDTATAQRDADKIRTEALSAKLDTLIIEHTRTRETLERQESLMKKHLFDKKIPFTGPPEPVKPE